MAFRKNYETLVVQKILTTVFRPGDRLYPSYRGYRHDEVVTARIIERPGRDEKQIPPHFNDLKIPIRIVRIDMMDVYDLTPAHFLGSAPDVQNIPELLAHLEHIYQKPITDYGNKITRIQLEYLDVSDSDTCALLAERSLQSG